MIVKPTYRVRLFLSVDLTGSTAFKQQKTNTLEWVKAFQEFYSNFPKTLDKYYQSACNGNPEIGDIEKQEGAPKLWKTVGDEILFCCRLYSQCHLSAAVNAFIESLIDFGEKAKEHKLNTKGNAWIGSFPSPNCSITAIRKNDQSTEDPLYGAYELPSEDHERKVDEDPSKFDFLGKGIDAGFRISKNSAIETLTISPGLGILLAQANKSKASTMFDKPIRLFAMQIFKGVANNEPYPVLTIDTSRNEQHRKLIDKQRELLKEPKPPESDTLLEYLKLYLKLHKIEEPILKLMYNSADLPPPKYYEDYCASWENVKFEAEASYVQAATQDDNTTASSQLNEKKISQDLQSTLDAIQNTI